MKKTIACTIILVTFSACTAHKANMPDPAATGASQANMPNPASLYCEQNGNTLKIVTAADGSQAGLCVFPDGSSCDEWAYFRGECVAEKPAASQQSPTTEPTINASGGYFPPGTSEPIVDWWGVIKSTEAGAQYDDYFERQDLGGSIYFGIDSSDPEIKAQIVALRDSGKIVHLDGTVFSNVADYNGSQVQVDRIEIE